MKQPFVPYFDPFLELLHVMEPPLDYSIDRGNQQLQAVEHECYSQIFHLCVTYTGSHPANCARISATSPSSLLMFGGMLSGHLKHISDTLHIDTTEHTVAQD